MSYHNQEIFAEFSFNPIDLLCKVCIRYLLLIREDWGDGLTRGERRTRAHSSVGAPWALGPAEGIA